MSRLIEPTGDRDLPPLSLRWEDPGDEALLFELYASTREEELAMTNWDGPLRQAFLNQQFAAMRLGYRSMYPQGEFSIILVDGQPAGRIVIHRGTAEVRVVDLVLLPALRNRGLGTVLMRRTCDEAARMEKPVRLCVLKNNRARRWYERLGFVLTGESGLYDELEWLPKSAGIKPVSAAD